MKVKSDGSIINPELVSELKLILETDNGIEKIEKSCNCNQNGCCQFCNGCVECNQKDFHIIKDEKDFCISIDKWIEGEQKRNPNPKKWTRAELDGFVEHLFKEALKEFLQHHYVAVCTDCAEKVVIKKTPFIINEWDKEKRKELFTKFEDYVFGVVIDNEKAIYKKNRLQELENQERER